MSERLVATVHGKESSGGLLAFDGEGWELVDTVPSHGIAVSPDGQRVARLVRAGDQHGPTLLMISDRDGLVLARRVPIAEPHSLLWNDDGLLAVSTGTNSLVWLDESGATQGSWSPGGDGDCWHLNCVTVVDGRLLVAAFGMFAEHREWTRVALAEQGIVFDVDRGSVLIDGLHAPHDVARIGGRWLVCNSGTGEVLAFDDPAAGPSARTELGGWVRGVATFGGRLVVGVTPYRASAVRTTQVVTLGDDLAVVDTVEVPAPNVYALAVVDDELVEGMLRSSRLTSMMAPPDARTDEPLEAADSRAEVRVLRGGDDGDGQRFVEVVITNRGRRTLVSAGDAPVYLGVRIRAGDQSCDVQRVHLPHALRPGRSVQVVVQLPEVPPDVDALNLCLVQEGVRWFDEVDPAAGAQLRLGDLQPAGSVR